MQTTWWTRPRSAILSVLVAALSACGGGGDEEVVPPPQDHPANIGAGRVRIEAPAQNPYATDRDSVLLSGSAFVSPTHYRCCSGSAADTAVSVGWSNSAGGGGSASQSVRYCSFFGFGPVGLCEHTWSTWVPLAVGSNIITISAHDTDGNVGYDSIRVTRVPDTTPPSVSSTYPADRAANVPENSSVAVAFSESIDPASITPDAVTVTDNAGNQVSGTVTATGAYGARFAVAGAFGKNTTHTATIGTGVRDTSGNALQSPYVWSFTTGTVFDDTPPTVIATDPASGSACAFSDALLSATFSESVDAATVNAETFHVTDGVTSVAGSISALSPGSFRFSPLSGLRYSASYTATLTNAVKDQAGNSQAANYSWTFSTVSAGTGTWRPTAAGASPPRADHTAVWTGSEMLVWGGYTYASGTQVTGNGYRYEADSDRWTEMSSTGAPPGRNKHVAVWTGSEMIVWGGIGCGWWCMNGARYDPLNDVWSPISNVGAPSESTAGTAVWTGTEMIVWSASSGARYNPTTDAWLSMPESPETLFGPTAIWTGDDLIVWGSGILQPDVASGVGAVYDPLANLWRPISTTDAPSRRSGHTAVWTGTEMIVWGGYENMSNVAGNSGAAYNPQTDTWRPIPNCGASARAGHTAVWTGSEMIVWGGSDANTGQAYNPVTNSWRQLAVVNAPSARWGHRAVWTGTTMIVWGGGDQYLASQYDSGGSYAP